MVKVWVDVGKGSGLDAGRIVVVARADSAPIRRLIAAVRPGHLIDLTFGRPGRTVAVLDSGHVVVLHLAPQALLERVNSRMLEEKTRDLNVVAPPLGSGGMPDKDRA